MKVTAYLRVGLVSGGDGYTVLASHLPTSQPIMRNGKPTPTAMFALDLDIPDSRFEMEKQVLAEIEMMESNMKISTEVVVYDPNLG